MGGKNKIRNSTYILVGIVLTVFLLTRCINKDQPKEELPAKTSFEEFAGSTVCANCHKDIYDTHLLTEHHLSSAPVTDQNILGSFAKNSNRYLYSPSTYVQMEHRDSGYYQAQYIYDEKEREGKFDIVIGSGRKGQSYLDWVGNRLVQLPMTYFTPAKTWSTSPGYRRDQVRWNRPITARCLECHTTFAEASLDPKNPPEHFDRNRIIYGVDCEKCHGPAAAHVKFQSENPQAREARFIVNPARLTRQQNLDLCALCHGGRLAKKGPSFGFQVGDTLADFFTPSKNPIDAISIDVHGNQLGLLSVSKCFMMSQMTCVTCHNTHENEKDKVRVFSERCQTCHTSGHEKECKMKDTIGAVITQNCIDCHMPKQESHSIAVYLQGEERLTPVLMRTHFIKPYPEEVENVMKQLKNRKNSRK